MGDQETDDFFAHFGVKGMRWGVQKGDKLTKGGRRLDEDIVLSKGTKIYNISADKARESSGHVYGAHRPEDIVNYQGDYANELKVFKGASAVFNNSFNAKTEIRAPSQKKEIDAFKDLWEKDKDSVARALAEARKDMNYGAAINARIFKLNRDNVYHKRIMNKGENWVNNKGYQEFSASLGAESNKSRDIYFKYWSGKGYNAVVDRNDTRVYGSKEPLLIFKGSKTLTNQKHKELSEQDIRLARVLYRNKKQLDKISVHTL